ncbi:MAG: sigma-54 dependent transcriptional regulator [Opitutus sp.]
MKLLLIGSEANIRRMLAFGLAAPDDAVSHVSRNRELSGVANLPDFDVALVDWERREESPVQILKKLRANAPQLPIIALVASPEEKLLAEESGASEVASKPVNIDELRGLLQDVSQSTIKASVIDESLRFVTESDAMEQVLSLAWRVAPTSASVLILGENGTGKTMLARGIHSRSERRHNPFVSLDCPCLQPQLLESELFGHVRGSFTGAVSDTVGKVATAEGGTLFLDEVGELPLEVQAKLLRLLQERCYERVGESRTHYADIRVLAATNRDLRQLVLAGRFREDLFYRLNVIAIELPPLRRRPEDIIPAAEYFLREMSRSAGQSLRTLSLSAREVLLGYPWPGNLRELRNLIERASILCDSRTLSASDFPELNHKIEPTNPQVGEFVTLDAVVEAHIRRVIARAESYEQAARILGIDKSTLYRWRKRLETLPPAEATEALAG